MTAGFVHRPAGQSAKAKASEQLAMDDKMISMAKGTGLDVRVLARAVFRKDS
jgi:hypothetical protein